MKKYTYIHILVLIVALVALSVGCTNPTVEQEEVVMVQTRDAIFKDERHTVSTFIKGCMLSLEKNPTRETVIDCIDELDQLYPMISSERCRIELDNVRQQLTWSLKH